MILTTRILYAGHASIAARRAHGASYRFISARASPDTEKFVAIFHADTFHEKWRRLMTKIQPLADMMRYFAAARRAHDNALSARADIDTGRRMLLPPCRFSVLFTALSYTPRYRGRLCRRRF